MKLWDSQVAIDDLLEALEAHQKNLADETKQITDKIRCPVKLETEFKKCKQEVKAPVKSLFYGTDLANSTPSTFKESFSGSTSSSSSNLTLNSDI